ncbi:143_t:CDS:2, partial [Scutellospora calospora]
IANILRNEVEKSQKQNLRNSLNRLMIDMLKVVENIGKMIIGFDDEKGLQDNNFKNRPFGNTDGIGYRGSDRVGFRSYEAKIRELSTDDLMKVFFHDKLASARQTAKSKRQRLDKPIISELVFSSLPVDAREYRKYTAKRNEAEEEKNSKESASRVISKVLEEEDKICSSSNNVVEKQSSTFCQRSKVISSNKD